jgi:TPP-dependent pyruvate/acetoin dehydrogenase alpha subunit
VTVCFFGDGASNEGAFHEAANMAALFELPLVFVCENNGYGEFTAQHRHQRVRDVAERAAGYGMPGVVVDGMDVLAVHGAAGEAVERARTGGGPTLVECKTYRFYDHVGVKGMRIAYRDDAEVAGWRERDPITALERTLDADGVLSTAAAADVHAEVLAEASAAIARAESAPFPDISALLDDVYSNPLTHDAVMAVAR